MMEEIEIEERSLAKGVTVLELRGSLDLHTTGKLSQVLENLAGRGRYKVIVDLEKISHVSSVGWGTLLKAGRESKSAGGELKLAAMSDRILKVFELLELGHELGNTATVDAALAAFSE